MKAEAAILSTLKSPLTNYPSQPNQLPFYPLLSIYLPVSQKFTRVVKAEAAILSTLKSPLTNYPSQPNQLPFYPLLSIYLPVPQKFTRVVKAEAAILSTLKSPFIARLFGKFQTVDELVLVLERCTGGDLWTVIYEEVRHLTYLRPTQIPFPFPHTLTLSPTRIPSPPTYTSFPPYLYSPLLPLIRTVFATRTGFSPCT